MIRLIGLRDRSKFRGAIAHFNILNHMQKGNFFIHIGGWGVGEVLEISLLREQIVMEFDYVAGFKELSFANAFNMLIPIEKNHFLARRFGDPDTFEIFALKNPVETIKMLLADLGPKTAFEIKDEVCELIIPEGQWQKWWQQARTKIKKDTFIQVPPSSKGVFSLSITEVTHEAKLQEAINKKPDINSLIDLVYSFMRDYSKSLRTTDIADTIITTLKEILTEEVSDAQELQIFFILQDLGEKKADSLNALVSNYIDQEKIFSEINIITFKKRFLVLLHKNHEHFEKIFRNILLISTQNPIRDYICSALIESKHDDVLEEVANLLLSHPIEAPALFQWYFQKIIQGHALPLMHEKGAFLESFFTLLYELEVTSVHRDLIKKMVQYLINKRFAVVRDIFKDSGKTSVQEILLLASKCQTLSDHDMKTLLSLAQVAHNTIGESGDEDQLKDVIWTTQEGYLKIKDKIAKIATVDAIETAREIETARAHGDLRENSEFKAAIEKRDRQQGEVKMLSDQMKHMRVLTEMDIDTTKVGVGTTITLKNSEGVISDYTILGPHDADIDNKILSFQSKLANSLMGLVPGDKCIIQGTEYTILSIKSFL